MIEKLLFTGFKVIIAAEGDQKILLATEFPDLEFVELKGYNLQFGSTKFATIFKIIFQIPKILTKIKAEKNWLGQYVSQRKIDLIISDNRFGLHHKQVLSVFITHQLLIKTSLGAFTDALLQRINYRYINRFNHCWVPDAAGEDNLAGALSHPIKKPATPITYTGVLSRMQRTGIDTNHQLLVLLSGPEPQRSILEERLLTQLTTHSLNAIVVRGLPRGGKPITAEHGLQLYDHLSKTELQKVINASEIIISRPGYSTVMDVLPLGKKCIFIPTPGQAEQEYLAAWLKGKGYVCTASQDNVHLPNLLQAVKKLQVPDLSSLKETRQLDNAIATLVATLNEGLRQ